MNIYISNLSYRVTDSDLKQLFEEFGKVASTKIILDHQTGRSKGFGFVDMADKDTCQIAIAKLNHTEFDGRIISVFEARPREESKTYTSRERRRGSNPKTPAAASQTEKVETDAVNDSED